jgi:hypothetical protein
LEISAANWHRDLIPEKASNNNRIAKTNFEPWNVTGRDVEIFDFNTLERCLPNNDFAFNLPFDFTRFGTLEYTFGNVEFLSNRGISMSTKGEQN